MQNQVLPIPTDRSDVYQGDCLDLIPRLPDQSIDIVVTSPPYWGQRQSPGGGTEPDPRDYIVFLEQVFLAILPKLKPNGIAWLNMGDAYNTPVNWTEEDYRYSSLGKERNGFPPENAAYTKPRLKRKAFIEKKVGWLTYGNLLMLPQRLLTSLTYGDYIYRGEVIWVKKNPMPEGRCRRPHRKHEPIYLLAKDEQHQFRTSPPVPSVWTFANEHIDGLQHRSRFPLQLPLNCIDAYGITGPDVVVLDPFSGSGSTGIAAIQMGCTYIGFEIGENHAEESRKRLSRARIQAELELELEDTQDNTNLEKASLGSEKSQS